LSSADFGDVLHPITIAAINTAIPGQIEVRRMVVSFLSDRFLQADVVRPTASSVFDVPTA
jgi:hypothetical protein